MKSRSSTLYSIIFVIFFASCNSYKERRIEPIQPVPASYMSLDIKVPMTELSEAVNIIIKDRLYAGGFPINKKNDSLFLEISRIRPLEFSYQNNKFLITAPIEVKTVLKKKVFGITVSNQGNPLIFKAIAKMETEMSLDENWQSQFYCTWQGLDWEDEPIFNLLGFQLNLSEFIESQLNRNRGEIEELVCNLLNDNVNIGQVLANVYQKIQQPARITSDPVPLYLSSSSVNLRGNILEDGPADTIVLHLEQQAIISITPFEDFEHNAVPLPDRENVLNSKSALSSFIEIRLPLDLLRRVIYDKTKDEKFSYEGYTGSIQSLKISSEKGRLKIELNIVGDLEGKVVVYAVPNVDERLMFELSSIDYEIVEMQKWVRLTDMAIHKAVEIYILNTLRFDTAPFFESLENRISIGIQESKLGDKMEVELWLTNFQLYSKGLSTEEIQFVFQMEGKSSLTLKASAFRGKL